MYNIFILASIIIFLNNDCMATHVLEQYEDGVSKGLRYRGNKGEGKGVTSFSPQDASRIQKIPFDQKQENMTSQGIFFYWDQTWESLKNLNPFLSESEEEQRLITKSVTSLQDESLLQEEKIDKDHIFSHLGQIWIDFENKNFESCFNQIDTRQRKGNAEALYLMGEIFENGYHGFSPSIPSATGFYHETLSCLEKMGHTKETSPLYRLASQGLERCKKEGLKRAHDPRYARSRPWQ